eukprot:gene32238-399_t
MHPRASPQPPSAAHHSRSAAGSGGDHEVLFALMPVKAVYDAGRNGWAVAWKEAHDPAEA